MLHPLEAGHQPTPLAAGHLVAQLLKPAAGAHPLLLGVGRVRAGALEPSCKVGLKHIHSRWCCRPHSGILIPNYLCCQQNN